MPQHKTIPLTKECYSEIAQPGERAICVSYEEMVTCGIKDEAIKKGLYRHRSGLVNCWPHHKEGRNVWIHYDGLKDKYKNLVRDVICGGIEVTVWLENEETRRHEREARRFASSLSLSIVIDRDTEEYFKDLDLFNATECAQLARACGWLKMLSLLTAKSAHAKGYKSISALRQAAIKEIDRETNENLVIGITTCNERVLTRKIADFMNVGADCLIDRRKFANKQNAVKLTEQAKSWLISEYGCPEPKISVVDLAEKYNTVMVEKYDWKKVTVSCIETFLMKPSIKKIWFKNRNGRTAAINTIMPQTVREKPKYPDNLWSIDGTPVQRYYIDEDGKVKSDIYMYIVADACSGAIVGHAFGVAENSKLVAQALGDALYKNKRKPYQVQYDQGSVHMSDAISGLMDNMSHVHFPCTGLKARPKWVERILGEFQEQEQQTKQDYKGANITARSLDAKMNPDTYRGKKEKLMTREELIKDLEASIEHFNTTGQQRDKHGVRYGDTRSDKYNIDYPGKEELTRQEISTLFTIKLSKKVQYKTNGITRVIDGKKRFFIVPDKANGETDFIFQSKWQNKEFTGVVSLSGFDTFIKLYDGDKYIATAYERTKLAPTVKDYQDGNGASPKGYLDALQEWEKENENAFKRAVEISETLDMIRPTGSGFEGNFQAQSKDDYNQWESKETDKINGMQAHNDLLDKLNAKYN